MCMLHYNPRHVSSINVPIFRRTNLLSQHLVSLLSVNGCTVCRMTADCKAATTTTTTAAAAATITAAAVTLLLLLLLLLAVCSHPAYCTAIYRE